MAFLPLALLAVSGCVPRVPDALPFAEHELAVGMFSRTVSDAALPADWVPWRIDPRKPSTRYALVSDDGVLVVHAQAAASVSGLIRRLRIDPVAYPMLRAPRAARAAALGAGGRACGPRHPYAMLMYIWSDDEEAGSIVANPRTSRVRMVVVEAGRTRLGRWLEYERDVVADFRRAFGEEPGPIVAVGVLTDADDTRTAASAYYGDISFARGE